MTQAATPRQDNTALSSMESDLLYEVVDGHNVEKEPMGAYEILLGISFAIFHPPIGGVQSYEDATAISTPVR